MTDVKAPTAVPYYASRRFSIFTSVLKEAIAEDVPFKHVRQLVDKFTPLPKPEKKEEKKLEAFSMCLFDEMSFLFDFYQAYFERLLCDVPVDNLLQPYCQELYTVLDYLIELEERVGTIVAKSDDGEGEDAYDDESEPEVEPVKPKKKVQITEEKKEAKKKPARKTKAKAKDDDDE